MLAIVPQRPGSKMRIPHPGAHPMYLLRPAVAASVLSLALATAAFAAPSTYTSDANHTYVRFSYSHMGFTTRNHASTA